MVNWIYHWPKFISTKPTTSRWGIFQIGVGTFLSVFALSITFLALSLSVKDAIYFISAKTALVIGISCFVVGIAIICYFMGLALQWLKEGGQGTAAEKIHITEMEQRLSWQINRLSRIINRLKTEVKDEVKELRQDLRECSSKK